MTGYGAGITQVIALSDERDAWQRVALARERAAYQSGWDDCLDHLADLIGGRVVPAHPSEIEKLRYPPGGRASWLLPDGRRVRPS
jgi:hypothetical protein